MLLADSDHEQCEAVEAYHKWQSRVELCAVVHDAGRVLQLLQAGLRPQVLVLDALTAGTGLFGLLRRLPTLADGYRPHILLTAISLPQEIRELFLTWGVEYIILKPYRMEELFEAVYLAGCAPEERRPYTLHVDLCAALREMRVGSHSRAVRYLELMLCTLVLERQDCSMAELYAQVAQAEHLSVPAVVSGITRLAARARQAGSHAYDALCAVNGRPAAAKLTNSEFVHGIADTMARIYNR